jgi:predicted P-loop ATPase
MSAAKAKTKTPPKATEPEAEDQPKQGTWRDDLLRDGSNRPYPNLANVAIALRRAPELKGLLAYDEMQREVVVTRRLPGSRTRAKYPRQQDDTDATAIQEWLQQNALRRISKEPVQQAMELIARENAFHPVRTYLTGLRRDESKNLIDNWLTTYLGAPDTEYTRAIGKYFLIAMVARIMRPGCKADYMLVLEDPRQGTGKSGVAATLGGDWFSDGLPNLRRGDEVRISQHMRGKWIIEIADLSATDNAEDSTLKAFLTRTEERFTPKYGRNEVKEPREFIFIGSTNETTWLRDATGGRRFWPVPTGTLDLVGLARDRDQLFAEAMRLFRDDAQWWPDPEFEDKHIKPEQEQRYEADEVWEQAIGAWLAGGTSTTISEVAREALFFNDTSKIGTRDQNRIRKVMRRLKWTRGERGPKGERYWVPMPPVRQEKKPAT